MNNKSEIGNKRSLELYLDDIKKYQPLDPKEEIILAGQNFNQLFVSKINKNGEILWNYNYLKDNNYHRVYEIKFVYNGMNYNEELTGVELLANNKIKVPELNVSGGNISDIGYSSGAKNMNYHFYTVSALKTAKKVLKIVLRASRATNIYNILGNFEDVLLLFSKI